MSVEQWDAPIDVATFEAEARHAHERGQLRECLEITDFLLSVHPDNETAHTLQSAICSGLDPLLNEARLLLENSHNSSEFFEAIYGAQVTLSKVLDIDPDHKGALALLQIARVFLRGKMAATLAAASKRARKEKMVRAAIPAVVLIIAMVGGLVFSKQTSFKAKPATAAHFQQTVPSQKIDAMPPLESPVVLNAAPEARQRLVGAPSVVVVKAQLDAVPPVEFGSFALSSPVATDIFEGQTYLGSTPTTLQLTAGVHTLEFRHEKLRNVVSQLIEANRTTSALVTFDIPIQINAKPWAQVFLDGAERQSLGQTPLSNVRVPIGRVLVFENPQFPEKSYRITGKETAIQVVFP